MRIFENILRENLFSDLNGYNTNVTRTHYMAYGSMPENFMAFAVSVDKLLPSDCELELSKESMSFTVSYKRRDVAEVYSSVNDKEVHCFIGGGDKKTIRFGRSIDNAAKRFVNGLSDKFTSIDTELERIRQKEIEYESNYKRMMSVRPDLKDNQRAEAAWIRSDNCIKYFALWKQQDNKITDPRKSKRRLMAFYNYMKNNINPALVNATQYNNVLNQFVEQIKLKARYQF